MRKLIIFISLVMVFNLFWRLRPFWISSFTLSPQHEVDPKGISDEFDAYANYAVFDNQKLDLPVLSHLDKEEKDLRVLGDTNSNKRIEIDLTNQKLYAYEGGNRVFDFLVSSGKWGRTPTGRFRIWIKLRSTKMEGGRKELGTYYYLPNVQYVMYFYNSEIPKWRGYGLHGTYWHSNFGHPMSHGCINMKTEEAQQIYQWASPDLSGKNSTLSSNENPGTEIIIYGEAPWE
jgi:lipoprotein-anchoring transpeptidase ErfK/SrfK